MKFALLGLLGAAVLVSAAPVSTDEGPTVDRVFQRGSWPKVDEGPKVDRVFWRGSWPKVDGGPSVDRVFQRLSWPKRAVSTDAI
jgi:hypothetical protein